MRIVGLTGLPRCGKDTLANLMVARHGWVKTAYAEALYLEVAEAFGVTVTELASNEWKTQPQLALMLQACRDARFVEAVDSARGVSSRVTPRTSRQILQWWGTEYRRYQDPTYWTSKLLDKLKVFYNAGIQRVVVSDVRVYAESNGTRNYNEFHALDEFALDIGGSMRLGEILREGAVDTGHVSDLRFPDQYIYARLQNDRTPETLFFQAGKEGLLS